MERGGALYLIIFMVYMMYLLLFLDEFYIIVFYIVSVEFKCVSHFEVAKLAVRGRIYI